MMYTHSTLEGIYKPYASWLVLMLLLTYREHAGIDNYWGSCSGISFLDGNLCGYIYLRVALPVKPNNSAAPVILAANSILPSSDCWAIRSISIVWIALWNASTASCFVVSRNIAVIVRVEYVPVSYTRWSRPRLAAAWAGVSYSSLSKICLSLNTRELPLWFGHAETKCCGVSLA